MSGHISESNFVVIETRRRWSEAERKQAVEATLTSPVSAVARKYGMAKSLLFRWRKEAGVSAKRGPIVPFVPVQIAAPLSLPSTALQACGLQTIDVRLIEIELAGGTKLRVSEAVKPEALRHIVAALRG